jgi:hypothetical protein
MVGLGVFRMEQIGPSAMKLASVRIGKKETYGAIVAGGLVDLGKKWSTARINLQNKI